MTVAATPAETSGAPGDGTHARRRLTRPDLALVFALALVVRLALVFASPGGFRGAFGYDASVYFDAANQLLHGRLPYGDFTLLHPTGLIVALTPFAALARLTTDHIGFMAGNAVFLAIGAANAALVAAIGGRGGLSRAAALLGGIVYAVWVTPATAEIGIRLEPLGSFCFLAGIFVLLAPERTPRRSLAGGILLGLAPAVKIWWIVPVAVVLAWFVLTTRRGERRGAVLRTLAGAGAALVVVLGPFFLAHPGPMWRMVVTDQLGRHIVRGNPLRRISSIALLPSASFHGTFATRILPALILLGTLLLAWRAIRTPLGRLVVPLAVIQVAVLLASPSFFFFYASYAAGAAALVVAAGLDRAAHRRWWRPPVRVGTGALIATALAGLTAFTLTLHHPTEIRPVPRPLAAVPSGVRCVTADSPQALIQLDLVNRNLSHGCPDWGDVSGRTYDVDASTGPTYHPRDRNLRWQRSIRRYLLSGDAFVMVRPQTGLSAATKALLLQRPVVSGQGKYALRAGCGSGVSPRLRSSAVCADVLPARGR